MLELRTKLATHYAYPGLAKAENVCVTVGSQEALFLAIKALCDPATDEVLIVSPCYPAYPKLCQLEGVAHREVLLDPERGFEPDAERVLSAVGPRTRLVLLASPANPTGRVWPRAELEKLAAGLGEVAVLLDEVYRELDYTGEAPFSIASVHPQTFVANSLSKSHALTGLRLGWLMGPAAPMQAVVKAHQFVNTAASTFSQRVALAALDAPSHREQYLAKRARLLALLEQHGLAHVPPDGAFYCMLRTGGDSVKLAYGLLEAERVVTVPGAAFGAEGWLRISWVADEPQLAEGIARIAHYLLK
jgi:aspartate/methionine/tyrosine aminotransferase